MLPSAKNTLTVSRELAHTINPIISETSALDTYYSSANLINQIGTIMSEIADKGLSIPHLYLICDAISSAIRYETNLVT
jgi:hypothetical protein